MSISFLSVTGSVLTARSDIFLSSDEEMAGLVDEGAVSWLVMHSPGNCGIITALPESQSTHCLDIWAPSSFQPLPRHDDEDELELITLLLDIPV